MDHFLYSFKLSVYYLNRSFIVLRLIIISANKKIETRLVEPPEPPELLELLELSELLLSSVSPFMVSLLTINVPSSPVERVLPSSRVIS